MTITDDFLNNMAKAAAGESFNTISHFSVGETVVTSVLPTDTVLAGEVGSRITASAARTNNSIEFTGVRTTADVVDTVNGDDIATFGSNTASTGSNLQSGTKVAGVTHTDTFDLELILTVTVTR